MLDVRFETGVLIASILHCNGIFKMLCLLDVCHQMLALYTRHETQIGNHCMPPCEPHVDSKKPKSEHTCVATRLRCGEILF